MLVSKLIELLQQFKESEGDKEVFITASGYYCEENIIQPNYPVASDIGVWSIGHSDQSY